MIVQMQPQDIFNIEMECLGGAEVIHNFTSEEDGKTFIVARDYWNWAGLNTYTLSLANGETAKAISDWRDIVPSPWAPRTKLSIEDGSGERIGAFTTTYLRGFPATIQDPVGKKLATVNYSGETWLIRSEQDGRCVATLEPKEVNEKEIRTWKFTLYNSSEVDPRLLGITAAFISHYYSEKTWPALFIDRITEGRANLWNALCTVASFGFNGLCDLSNWAISKLEKFSLFVVDDFAGPTVYNAAILCVGISILLLSIGMAHAGVGISKAAGATMPRIFDAVVTLLAIDTK